MKDTSIPRELFSKAPPPPSEAYNPEVRHVGYFGEAIRRFVRHGASRIALCVIAIIALFSLVAPLVIPRDESVMDPYYAKLPPRVAASAEGMGLLHGEVRRRLGGEGLTGLAAIAIGAAENDGATLALAMGEKYSPIIDIGEAEGRIRPVKIDAYLEVGFVYKSVTREEYELIIKWQEESGERVLFPLVADNEFCPDIKDANMWYKADSDGFALKKGDTGYEKVAFSEEMTLEDNYMYDTEGNPMYSAPTGRGDALRVRVLYYNYYRYKNGAEPDYIFGTDSQGYDLALRVAGGIRVSLLLAIVVSLINFLIGALVGAVEGYYGGAVDLAIERVTDILSGVPFIVVATLFQIYLSDRVGAIPSLLFAFVLTGWLGTANRVRAQFYRYKSAEYVLAARSMGASDARIMWRHIFPNTLGTLITASALAIPGVIFTESMLSFLGIVNLGAEGITSLGTLLSDASGIWVNYPHLMMAPALIISLLMISFNLIGNGLREAFNPSMKGDG